MQEYIDITKSNDFLKKDDEINKIKNVESVKSSDRCFEIQYNKFFW
jgi:hypothetical protein